MTRDQVRHFMHDDVFKKFRGFFGQIGIETDAASTEVAASPSGFHPPNKEPCDLHAHQRFPLGDQWRHSPPDLLPIPSVHDGLFVPVMSSRTQSKHDLAVLQLD